MLKKKNKKNVLIFFNSLWSIMKHGLWISRKQICMITRYGTNFIQPGKLIPWLRCYLKIGTSFSNALQMITICLICITSKCPGEKNPARKYFKIEFKFNKKKNLHRHYWKNSPVRPACDAECKKRMLCDLRSGKSHDRKLLCQELESRIDANTRTGWKAWIYNGLALS